MKEQKHKILLVDDEPDILEFIGYNLKKEGYKVYTAQNGEQALAVANEKIPDLILLDIMMPGIDGVEVCRQLRLKKIFDNTIIVFLTARGEDYSEIAGFEAGADDYITKPIRPRVLLARIKALLNRGNRKNIVENLIQIKDLTINPSTYTVKYKDEVILLPKKEFEILLLLSTKPGKIFTRDEIYLNVWGNSIYVGDRTLDVHIRKLREKIGDNYIKTSKGVGYGIFE
ncbi:MAG: response regulator transcription factor [Bacteroidetes bacterium]|nr:response regulator transcription factor [Bacteroidota bacterium]